MRRNDKERFLTLISDVCAFYRQSFSEFVGDVWWKAMEPYDFAAVADALNRYCVNPDNATNARFMPYPSDIVKMLGGTSLDSALSAWTKVERAIRSVGTYHSVVFDDPIIHRVIHDMGGWVKLGSCPSEDDFVFVGKDFQNRYRGFAMRNERGNYPRVLIGLAEAQNMEGGRRSQPPQAIGNPDACILVYKGGESNSGVSAQPLRLDGNGLKLISNPKDAA